MEPNATEGNYKESKPSQVYSRNNLRTAEQVDEGDSIRFLSLHVKLLIHVCTWLRSKWERKQHRKVDNTKQGSRLSAR